MTDQNANTLMMAPAPQAANPFIKGLVLASSLLVILSIVSNGYLWHLWRQDQAIQQVLTQPNPELQALKIQVQALSGDLDQVKKTVELYQAANEALQEDLKQLRESQNVYENQVRQQLQDYREQSVQRQQQQMQNQKRNPVTW